MTTMPNRRRARPAISAIAVAGFAAIQSSGCYVGVRWAERPPSDGQDEGTSGLGDDDGAQGSESGGEGDASCEHVAAVRAPLRRLSNAAYVNTIRDVLGLDVAQDLALLPDDIEAGFRHNLVNPVTQLGVEKYLDAAEEIAARVVSESSALPCDPAAAACGPVIAETLGRRLLRRPLHADELARLTDLHASAATPEDGTRLVLQALLQSPWFLYLVEQGDTAEAEAHRVPLTSHELAARLSYFLWMSAPDDELLDLADDDQLGEPGTLTAQAERMLADPRASLTIASFHRQWLTRPEQALEHAEKDPEMFPEFGPSLRDAMIREMELRPDLVIRHGDGTLVALLTSTTTVVDDELAALYGIDRQAAAVSAPAGFELPEGMSVVELPADERVGILGLAGIWTDLAKPSNTNIPLRGAFVAEQILCLGVGAPPASVDAELPPPDPNASARERLEQETKGPSCTGCHALLNPLGFLAESYDAIGRFRTTDAFGHAIDTTAELPFPVLPSPLDGPVELAQALPHSPGFPECVASHWFRFGFGIEPTETDGSECGFDEIMTEFTASGHDLRTLLVGIATSEAFAHRPL